MRALQGGLAAALAVVFLVALTPSSAAVDETLAFRLPLHLDGAITQHSGDATVALRSAENAIPRLELMFSAASAHIRVLNVTVQEQEAGPRLPEDLYNRPTGGSDDLMPRTVEGVDFYIQDLGADFLFAIRQGAAEGAEYRTTITESPARLDLEPAPRILSYREEPKTHDMAQEVPAESLRLSAGAMHHEVRGDFTFWVHGALFTALTPDSTDSVRTGTWKQTTGVEQGPVSQPVMSQRTTTYAIVEVTDGILSMSAVGGVHDVWTPVDDVVIDVEGRLRAPAAAGSVDFEGQEVRASGEGYGGDGRFTIKPLWVAQREDKILVATLTGSFDSLSVGPQVFTRETPVAAIAYGAGGLLAALGAAYVWKTGLLVPLYAKLTKAKVLDQETRSLVHAKIEQDPGCQVKQVAEALNISWTTASYHLRVLRKMGLVVAKRQGRHEHFFVAGSAAAATHAVVSALQHPTARQIVETVLYNPGIIQKDLCERLSIAPSTASGHLSRLRDVGALREQRDWKKRRYFAGEALHRIPIPLHGLERLANGPLPPGGNTAVPAH